MKLAEEKEGNFLVSGEKLSSYFLLVRMCGIGWNFIVISGDKSPFGFLLVTNLTLDLPLCQERQEGIRRSSICILRTISREMMNESRISGMVVVVASSLTIWGS